MTAAGLRVLCANCGGDERLSRLEEGTVTCPWCGLPLDDDGTPAGEPGPVFLHVVA